VLAVTASSHDSAAALAGTGYFVSQASHPVSAHVAGATGAVFLTTHVAIGYRMAEHRVMSCPTAVRLMIGQS